MPCGGADGGAEIVSRGERFPSAIAGEDPIRDGHEVVDMQRSGQRHPRRYDVEDGEPVQDLDATA
jgi:hypothetical protein